MTTTTHRSDMEPFKLRLRVPTNDTRCHVNLCRDEYETAYLQYGRPLWPDRLLRFCDHHNTQFCTALATIASLTRNPEKADP